MRRDAVACPRRVAKHSTALKTQFIEDPHLNHIVLFGDSIFDNGVYVAPGTAVIDHLSAALPDGDKATLLAIDGAVTSSVFSQLDRCPKDATHLFLSVGGNDALGLASELFMTDADNVGAALDHSHDLMRRFDHGYKSLLNELASFQLPLTVCTIYDSVPGLQARELAGLMMFNDLITRNAFASGADLIDLRLLCQDPGDYSEISPIEPSGQGGKKIAQLIAKIVSMDTRTHSSRVFA